MPKHTAHGIPGMKMTIFADFVGVLIFSGSEEKLKGCFCSHETWHIYPAGILELDSKCELGAKFIFLVPKHSAHGRRGIKMTIFADFGVFQYFRGIKKNEGTLLQPWDLASVP